MIIALIIVNVIVVLLETEPVVVAHYAVALRTLYLALGIFFIIEYVLRFLVAGSESRFAGWRGRLRYLVCPSAMIDLVAILPFVLLWGSPEGFILRLVRLAGLVRLGAFSRSRRFMTEALHARREELWLCLGLAFCVLIFSATGLFLAEGRLQPDAFGSIPRALWWGVATLTTVGYGDVVPITTPGRIIAGLTALVAIALIALVTSVLAGAFSDATTARSRDARRHAARQRRQGGGNEMPRLD